MITEKDLDNLINRVDKVVDKQFDFIKEMKNIKFSLWEFKNDFEKSVATSANAKVEEVPLEVSEKIEETSSIAAEVPLATFEKPELSENAEVETSVEAITEEVDERDATETASSELIEDEATEITEEETAETADTAPTATAPIATAAMVAPEVSNRRTYGKSLDDFLVRKDHNWNWERFIGENLFNKIGILIIIIGVFIGVRYSIEHNLISPAMRLVLGYLTGVGLFVFGALSKKKYPSFSAILVSGAMTIFYFVTFIGYSFFGLFPQLLSFVLMFLFTAFTVFASLSYNQVAIAIIGLVGSYAVPFLLSNNSGRVDLLFAYTAIINIGVLILSFYKEWRSLYLSAFFFTWVLLLSMWGLAYKEMYFYAYLLFNGATFATFYVAFIAQKLRETATLSTIDVTLFLTNSLLFYGLGYWTLEDRYYEQPTYIALFTLGNALLHFGVAHYLHTRQKEYSALKYLVLVLSLSFATLVIPIQFEGPWVTLFWSVEAALLFWFGRSKGLAVYERISYGVTTLATGSLLIVWGENYFNLFITYPESFQIVPFGNAVFINALVYCVAMGFMAYTHYQYKQTENPYRQSVTFFLNAFWVLGLYYTFFREIGLLCDMRALAWAHSQGEQVQWEDLSLFKNVWQLLYSMGFLSAYSLLNLWKARWKHLAEVQIGLSFFLGALFITMGLYDFSELRERYITESLSGGTLSLWFLNIRYIGLAAFALLIYSIYRLQQFLEVSVRYQHMLTTLFHLSVLWVGSSELLHWSDLFHSHSSYKLGLTILWGSYAVLLVVLGIFQSKKYLRIWGIVVIGVALLKLFFYDTTHLDTIAKTIVFVVLGFLLLIASFLYNKYTKKILDSED